MKTFGEVQYAIITTKAYINEKQHMQTNHTYLFNG